MLIDKVATDQPNKPQLLRHINPTKTSHPPPTVIPHHLAHTVEEGKSNVVGLDPSVLVKAPTLYVYRPDTLPACGNIDVEVMIM